MEVKKEDNVSSIDKNKEDAFNDGDIAIDEVDEEKTETQTIAKDERRRRKRYTRKSRIRALLLISRIRPAKRAQAQGTPRKAMRPELGE